MSKLAWGLAPLVFMVQQDEKVCSHRDGRGATRAIDPAAIERAYRDAFLPSLRVETASTSWKRAALPSCGARRTRRESISKVSEKLVGRRWTFSAGDPPIAEEAYRWFRVRCVPSTVTIVDSTHVEVIEE